MIRSVFVLLFVAAPVFADTTTWEIDPTHSSAQFAIRHLMVSTVRGDMGKVTGTVILDDADLTRSRVEATVDATGIDTREAKRDAHLRSADFLDTAQYPTISFVSKRVAPAGDGRYKVTGDLTLRGVTKEIVLDVAGSPTPIQDPFGKTRLGGTVTTRFDRQDFGVAYSKLLDNGGMVVGNDVEVTIDVELVRK